jgi:hypothetical protein
MERKRPRSMKPRDTSWEAWSIAFQFLLTFEEGTWWGSEFRNRGKPTCRKKLNVFRYKSWHVLASLCVNVDFWLQVEWLRLTLFVELWGLMIVIKAPLAVCISFCSFPFITRRLQMIYAISCIRVPSEPAALIIVLISPGWYQLKMTIVNAIKAASKI